tara:strand:- start:15502 stop:15702 length:201 start_codon:yes stop_codon:yes gene_type:complete
MRKIYTEEQLADVLTIADKIVSRAHRGIPVDRWATQEEMRDFVMAYEWCVECTQALIGEVRLYEIN